ncbi:MAG: thioredoxin domain-containing protein [Candidatus Aenigmarchaeota archaeon]|nr:thioredoxin domain-containing protein [Candidatus Aenigmarchaeota archaeon]
MVKKNTKSAAKGRQTGTKEKRSTGKNKTAASKAPAQTQAKKPSTEQINPWIISTGVLAILLIASVFTGGFDLNKNDDYAKTIGLIDTMIDSSITAEAKSSLETAKSSVETALTAEATAVPEKKTGTSDNLEKPVTLDMYIMSQCPYGVQAEDGAIPAVKKLIDSVDYNIYFIANDNGDGTFSSLHGQPEVDENMRQICIMEKYPEQFLDYLTCLNKDYRNAGTAWKSCAESNSIDTTEIETCQTGDEGKALFSESIAQAKSVGASGSPTIYLNGELYQSGRDALSFTRAICQLAPEEAECATIPACTSDADCTKTGFIGKCLEPNTENAECEYTQPPTVNIKVLNDETCAGCDTTAFDSINEQLFINTETTVVDISSDEGKALLEELKPQQVPTYIFDETLLESSEYARLEQFFTKTGEHYILSPSIVGQYIESPKMIGREKIEGKLDLFAMSECPYGVMAENNMEEVLNTFGDNIDFSIHFIASDNGDGTFSSLHGQKEVDENIRQVCVMEHNNAEFFSYLMCQNANYNAGTDLDTTWEACAEDNSIDTATIQACYTGDEGAELLRANIELTNELGIGSSPTFLINNQIQFGGALPADEIKTKFCAENPDTEGCDATLSTESDISTSGSC